MMTREDMLKKAYDEGRRLASQGEPYTAKLCRYKISVFVIEWFRGWDEGTKEYQKNLENLS